MKSEQEICDFISSRGVSSIVVDAFKVNKVDGAVLNLMSDDQLHEMGLIAFGDKVLLRQFCEGDSSSSSDTRPPTVRVESQPVETDVSQNRRKKLLELLKRKQGRTTQQSETCGRPKKSSRMVNFGLRVSTGKRQDDGLDRQATLIKSPLGDKNAISLTIDNGAMYDIVLEQVINAFFPNLINPVIGSRSDFDVMELVNGRNTNVKCNVPDFTLGSYIKEKMISGAVRLYLLCVPKLLEEERMEEKSPHGDDHLENEGYLPDLDGRDSFELGSPSGEILLRRRRTQTTPAGEPQPSTSQPRAEPAGPHRSASYARHVQYTDIIDVSESDSEESGDIQAAIEASLLDDRQEFIEEEKSLVYLIRVLEGSIHREDPPTLFNVVRGRLLDGASRALKRRQFDIHSPFSIKFMDDIGVAEGAVDEGGPKREFFTFVMHEIGNSNIFSGTESSKMIVPLQSAIEKDHYYIAGLLMVLSLAHGCQGPHFFSPTLYDLVTKGCERTTPRISDVQSPDTRHILEEINNASNMDELLAAINAADTILDIAGCNFPARVLADKTKILDVTIRFLVIDRARQCIDKFLAGLSTFNFLQTLRDNPATLRPLFFPPEQLTASMIRDLFVPSLSERDSNSYQKEVVVMGFWNDYLLDLEDGDKPVGLKDVLLFATGSEIIPPCGFDTEPTLGFVNDSKFPVANTCGAILRIPLRHRTYEEYVEAMEFGILNSPGFGMA